MFMVKLQLTRLTGVQPPLNNKTWLLWLPHKINWNLAVNIGYDGVTKQETQSQGKEVSTGIF